MRGAWPNLLDLPEGLPHGAPSASATSQGMLDAPQLESKCVPSPGGSVSGMGACHPDDLPEGYHTADRGRSWRCRVRLRRGPPTVVRAVGLRQVDGMALAGEAGRFQPWIL